MSEISKGDELINFPPKQDKFLLAAGFEPTEEDELWIKEGIHYGREAALQYTP